MLSCVRDRDNADAVDILRPVTLPEHVSTLPCDYLSYSIHVPDIAGELLLLQKHVGFVSSQANADANANVLPCTLHCAYIKLYELGIPLIKYYPEAPLGWSDAEEGGFQRDKSKSGVACHSNVEPIQPVNWASIYIRQLSARAFIIRRGAHPYQTTVYLEMRRP